MLVILGTKTTLNLFLYFGSNLFVIWDFILLKLKGFEITEIRVNHRPRRFGKGNYTIIK